MKSSNNCISLNTSYTNEINTNMLVFINKLHQAPPGKVVYRPLDENRVT